MTQNNVQLQNGNGSLAGYRNLLINGSFGVWQRGTSGLPAPSAVNYYADRWASYKQSGAAINDVQQIVDAPDISGVSISTRTNACDLRQVIEAGGFTYLKVGTTWTLSGWAKGTSAASTLIPQVLYVQSSEAVPAVTTLIHAGSTVNVGTNWTYWSTTFTVASPAPVGQDHVMVQTSTPGDLFQTAIQLEPGPVATPFEQRPYGLELSLCQRYYQTGGADVFFMFAQVWSGTGNVALARCFTQLRGVAMRTSPTESVTKVVGPAGTSLLSQSTANIIRIVTDPTVASSEDVRFKYDSADAEL